MIKVAVLKNGKQAFGGQFKNKEEADSWIKEQENKGSWGKPAEYELVVEEFVPKEETEEELIKKLRANRNNILCKTDWLFVSDFRVPTKYRKIYMEYRQYLRDLPKTMPKGPYKIEPFENFLRRKYPEEFLDGGDNKVIMRYFNAYIGEGDGTI